MFKAALQILAASFLAACLTQAAQAEKRVALIMGNSAYENVGRLANPSNDAEAMAATLKAAGFDVVDLKRDLKVVEMRRVLRDLSAVARDADVAIIYYAGHGIEIDGTNYVIPTDAVLEHDIDAYDETNSRIRIDRIIRLIEHADAGMVMMIGVQSNQVPRTLDLSRPLRQWGILVGIGGFHMSGVISIARTLSPLKGKMNSVAGSSFSQIGIFAAPSGRCRC